MTNKEKKSLEGMATDISWIRSQLEKDCGRIDSLEKDVAKAKGWAAAIGIVTSAVVTWIGRKL